LHRQNIGKEKLLTSQKYWFRQNIAAGKISAKKKYLHRKNIGFDKISIRGVPASHSTSGEGGCAA
jgi:hypothetical protein